MFNCSAFNNRLSTAWLGHHLHYFEELESTNTYAKQQEGGELAHGSVILTDTQTKGRGQYQRQWQTTPGQNLTFSLIFTPAKADRLPLLTLGCALAITELMDLAGDDSWASIKWPNDVLVDNKKMAGILTETQFSGDKLNKVIVGIGLNVNQRDFWDALSNKATSLFQLTQKEQSREEILAELLQRIEYYYRLWVKQDEGLPKAVNCRMLNYGEWVKLTVGGKELTGRFKFLGINAAGVLVALDEHMDVQKFAYEQVRVNL
ncbi:MAG: biotin--[acetyl-CoA-carboxylase] ligase [Balneolaceae bacterium]|nr:biotin--[acetyl-CoA-carboxylase] ligase [Balneolaceae bacterium]